mmetsp:Transcript_42576/g.112354  ORF Transcript_42576/g.112354 Transcript_42576/m.112354 type:complete len:222 (+) Transcript_42576:565-1230(+)
MCKGSNELVVQLVSSAQHPQTQKCLHAMQPSTRSTKHVVSERMRGTILPAKQNKRFEQLDRFLHGILLEKLVAIRIVVDLPWLSARTARGGALHLFLLINHLGLCALLLVLQLFLLCSTQLLLFLTLVISVPSGKAESLLIVKHHVNSNGVLGCPAVKFVGEEPILHPQHRNVRFQGRLPQAVVVKIELVLRNVVEMIKCLGEFLQRFSILLLSAVTPPYS